MDEATQRNSALVEENAATAKTLENQAKSMDEQVAFFQIDAVQAASEEPKAAAIAAPRHPVPKQQPKTGRAAPVSEPAAA